MKERLKVYCAENESGRVIELEPNPEEHTYYNVANIKGVDGPNKSLRTNILENLIFVNLGNEITIKIVNLDSVGLRDTNIYIKTQTKNQPDVTIEDYISLKKNGLILANSIGILEIFTFNVGNNSYQKLSELDFNKNRSVEFEQITNIAINDEENLLSVATCVEKNDDVVMNSLRLFRVNNNGSLVLLDERKYNLRDNFPMYFYLNFDYKCEGIPVLFAFQAEGERNLDIFTVENDKLNFVHTEHNYHKNDFSAIRSINGKIFSIDYNGILRILNVPE